MANLGMPKIDIVFKQLLASLVERSSKGKLALIVVDETPDKPKTQLFKDSSEIKTSDFDAANVNYMVHAFRAGASEVLAVRLAKKETIREHATPLLKVNDFDWVALASGVKEQQDELAAFVKEHNKKTNRKVKAVVYDATAPDDMHVVNFCTKKFTETDNPDQEGWKLIPRIAGILAGIPFSMASTYWKLPGVFNVEEPEDLDAAIADGKFILFNDAGVTRVARGVNSLTTIDADHTDDMKSIAIVEAMDLITRDIHDAFKIYIGKYKNKYDNQCLFMASVNAYFEGLEMEDVLDEKYDNHVEVNVAEQRKAWQAVKSEAVGWDDQTIKERAFKRKVFLNGYVKILDAMEDLKISINMV